jgi:hypothetical protein
MMTEVPQAADSGDEAAARFAFAGATHDITHDIDVSIRAADPELARYFCETMVALEEQLAGTPDLQAVGAEAGIAAELLQESGRALDLID